MSEVLASSKFLKKYYKIIGIEELVLRLTNLPEDRFVPLAIKDTKFDRSIKWKNEKISLKDLLAINTPEENKKLLIGLLPQMLKIIDSDADVLIEGRAMKAPGSIMEGGWVDSAYSSLLISDRNRRNSLRHILDQLLL